MKGRDVRYERQISLFDADLPPALKVKIIQAHRAKVTPRAISKYLNLPLSQVRLVIAQDEKRRAELDQRAQVLGYSGSSGSSASGPDKSAD